MSEHAFGVSQVKPTRKVARIMERVAKRHGAWLVEATLPGTGYQRWFATLNLGFPFNERTERANAAVFEEMFPKYHRTMNTDYALSEAHTIAMRQGEIAVDRLKRIGGL